MSSKDQRTGKRIRGWTAKVLWLCQGDSKIWAKDQRADLSGRFPPCWEPPRVLRVSSSDTVPPLCRLRRIVKICRGCKILLTSCSWRSSPTKKLRRRRWVANETTETLEGSDRRMLFCRRNKPTTTWLSAGRFSTSSTRPRSGPTSPSPRWTSCVPRAATWGQRSVPILAWWKPGRVSSCRCVCYE